jgi:CSLREA domain-containing protein
MCHVAEATGALGCYCNSSVQQIEVASLFQVRIIRALFSIAVALALGMLGVAVAPASAASTWVVTSADDTDGTCGPSQCTLRAAIKAANASAGEDIITFDISPAGPKTIVVGQGTNSGLPIISGSDIVIDATTQPGGGAHGIRLDDPDVGGGENGLVLEGNRITIRGFSITRFDGWGILVWGGSSERIQGNRIGTSDGVTDQGTGDDGIRLQNGGSSLIGGSSSGDGNLISGGNNDGIEIRHSNDNVVSGNMVGLTADGLSRLPNASTGIELSGTSSGNRIGGLSPGERNYASGNDGIGVQLIGNQQPDGSCLAPEYNVVEGNYLGLDVNGGRMSPSGNRGEGVALHVCAHHNTIGGTTAAARNIISGNAADGVEMDSTGGPGGTLAVCDNKVQGNYIGLSPSGLGRRDNFDDGVGLDNGACNNVVGGTEAGARNYIAGNSNDGVEIAHVGSNSNVVEGNIIGLGVNNTAIHNGWYGVMFRSKPQRNILRSNVISGNAQGGVRIQDNLSYYNEIRQNQIGTDISGTEARANHGHGVLLFDGPSENLMSGNTIMWNTGAGIAIEHPPGSSLATHDNRITNNRMGGNGGLGIDLLPTAGVNPVDGVNNDVQTGNNGIDSPVISQATANVVRGTAPPNTSVEVYMADPDASEANAEGSTLIDTVTSNASGEWCLPQSGLSGTVTATATDTSGNTSEFSSNATAAGDEAACGTSAEPDLLFADDFTGPDGSPPANWAINRSAGGTGAGATIQGDTLREDVVLAPAQDGSLQYVQARAKPVQPNWSTGQLDLRWQMQTDANSNQTVGAFLAPQALTSNVSNASDYLRVRVANGRVTLLRRTAGGSPTTIWSEPVTAGSTLRQFELRIDGTDLWLYEGALGSTPTLRAGPIAHGLTWTSGYLYLHAHNSSSATPYLARFDTVRIYDRDGTDATAPTVGAVAPVEGATGVASTTSAEATFSEAMDPSTISNTTFTLIEQGAAQPVTARVDYDAAVRKATLDPDVNLEAGATYTATLEGEANGVKDLAGNPLAADRTWSFSTAAAPPQDTTPPETTIDSEPPGITSSSSANFAFSSSEAGSTFECSIDGTPFSSCTSPKSYSNLSDGSHTFQVRAMDAVGNTDASPAAQNWTVDTTVPDTAIDSGPSGTITVPDATFSFSSSEAGSTFECSIDGAPFGSCTSPKSYSNLPNGPHTFEVRAKDSAGNVDASSASRTFTVDVPPPPQDTIPPETTIDSGPSGATKQNSATFSFSSSEAGSTFECSIDGAPFGSCTSPKKYTGLAGGSHTFQVRAIDSARNVDPTPAIRTWTVRR